jgi:hypothetical protein
MSGERLRAVAVMFEVRWTNAIESKPEHEEAAAR